MKHNRKKAWSIFRILLTAYVIIGILLFFFQDLFLFHPIKLSKTHSFLFNIPFNEINLEVDGKRNLNIIQFSTAKKRKGIVLYFHGNMRNIERYAHFAPFFTRNGWDIWMIDYPGFGKTTGRRTEKRINEDALRFYNLAVEQEDPEEIIIYGKSLGTGVASYLASTKKSKQLILETPYYSMKTLTNHYAPIYPSFLTKYSFPTYKYLKTVKVPITIMHGLKDEIIPYNHSERLKIENRSIRLLTVPKGKHNTLYKFPEVPALLDSLLSS